MNALEQQLFDLLAREKLPRGWKCEKAFGPGVSDTHLIAPRRSGGVVVKPGSRMIRVQLPGSGPAAEMVNVEGRFTGPGWLERMVKTAVQTAFEYAPKFRKAA